MFFTESERRFSSLWIFSWSLCCLVSCSFTIFTFLIETSRFQYPERPIIFLSVCYFMVALCYVLGYAFGDEVACQPPFPPPDGRAELAGDMARLITQGTKKESCTILFMLLYFFTMASYVWWCVLALTWFLSAGLKWGHEAIENHSHYFHIAAWAVPAVKTIAILSLNTVEGKNQHHTCNR
jgi:frizzled protein 1/7